MKISAKEKEQQIYVRNLVNGFPRFCDVKNFTFGYPICNQTFSVAEVANQTKESEELGFFGNNEWNNNVTRVILKSKSYWTRPPAHTQ